MSKIWHFPLSNRTTSMGLAGSGTDQFSNEPINNLAREIIQNSLDARAGKDPVIVEFHKFTTPISEFPGADTFVDYIMKLNKQYARNPKADEKEKKFVNDLLKALNTEKICWLRISDFNTSGLYGAPTPADQNTPWFAFIKGAGKNQKDDTSGGSKGLGKNAIFVNSLIRTMFVSTLAYNKDTGLEETYNTGITKLLSYVMEEEDPTNPDWTQGIGFCVEDDENAKKYNSPNKGLLNLDPEFDRSGRGYGTDIYLPFFGWDEKWDDTIAMESLISFMPAILDRDLIVRLTHDDTTVAWEISPQYISTFIAGKGKKKAEAKALYNVLTSNQTIKIHYEKKEGFEMTLHMLQDNIAGLNEVYEYRLKTKMLIRHERKDCSVGYTGILFIEGDSICKRLRSIEDATHRKWAISRYRESGYEKKDLEQALQILDNFVECECSKFGTVSSEEKVYLDISGWNGEEASFDMSLGEQKEFGLPTEEVVFSMKSDTVKNPRRKPFKKKATEIDDKGDAESDILDIGQPGEGDEEYSHPTGHNKNYGGEYHAGDEKGKYDPDQGEHLVMGRRRIQTSNAKMPSINPSEGIFDLVFTPRKTGIEIEIEVLKSGVDGGSEETYIYSAVLENTGERLETKGNIILMNMITKDTQYRIHLKTHETTNYVWEVNIYGKE